VAKEEPERQQYGDYEVTGFLGKGSIGKVWLARHRRIGRQVALKTIQLEQKFEDEDDRTEFYKRLQREAELCAAMQHPNIVTLYDVGYDGDVVSYFATEYVDGESLLARLRRTRPLPLAEAMSIASDLLRGLAYAHAKGVIHRDIKPANILLTSEGQAKIADFGVARPLHSSLTATRSLVGTPNYMSPEQVKTTPVSIRSDLFSAGVVLYEMLTGVKPFAAPELSGILYNVVNVDPPPASEVNPAVPRGIAQLVARLLEKKPEDRYPSAADALADADAAMRFPIGNETISHHEITTPLDTMIDATSRPFYRRPVPAPLFWVVSLLLAGGLAASVVQLREQVREQQPVGIITTAQEQRHQAKRRALDAARARARSGQYADAITAYDVILARYPESLVARQEREETQRLLEEATPKSEITKVARKPRRETTPEKVEAEKKPSRWERFKRWWRGPEKPQ
jgi:serine/threonine protein kinase